MSQENVKEYAYEWSGIQVIVENKETLNFKTPKQDAFNQWKPVYREFMEVHKRQLSRLDSFVCMIANINDHHLIYLGTDCNLAQLKIRVDFKGLWEYFNLRFSIKKLM